MVMVTVHLEQVLSLCILCGVWEERYAEVVCDLGNDCPMPGQSYTIASWCRACVSAGATEGARFREKLAIANEASPVIDEAGPLDYG